MKAWVVVRHDYSPSTSREFEANAVVQDRASGDIASAQDLVDSLYEGEAPGANRDFLDFGYESREVDLDLSSLSERQLADLMKECQAATDAVRGRRARGLGGTAVTVKELSLPDDRSYGIMRGTIRDGDQSLSFDIVLCVAPGGGLEVFESEISGNPAGDLDDAMTDATNDWMQDEVPASDCAVASTELSLRLAETLSTWRAS